MLTDEEMLRDSSQFYGIKHENICSLIGHIVDNGEPLAIFPWAESKFELIIRWLLLVMPFTTFIFSGKSENVPPAMSVAIAEIRTIFKILHFYHRSYIHRPISC